MRHQQARPALSTVRGAIRSLRQSSSSPAKAPSDSVCDRHCWRAMVDEFRYGSDTTRDAFVAHSLVAWARASDASEVVDLIEKSNKPERSVLLLALKKLQAESDVAAKAIRRFMDQPELLRDIARWARPLCETRH